MYCLRTQTAAEYGLIGIGTKIAEDRLSLLGVPSSRSLFFEHTLQRGTFAGGPERKGTTTRLSSRVRNQCCYFLLLLPDIHSLSRPFQDSCGDWVAALCKYGAHGDAGCSQDPGAPGENDVKVPGPHDPDIDVEESEYKVRVRSGQMAGCSEAFSLLPSERAPQPGDVDGPFLEMISPMENDSAVAGEDYTVEVRVCSAA